MSSKRFPGKTLVELIDRPLLAWVIQRVRCTTSVSDIVVSTSNDQSDDAIQDFCERRKIPCFRGSLNNVATRMSKTVTHMGAAEFIRISGDSPLIDPSVIDHAVALFSLGNYDLVTNVLRRTFPKGQSVEVLKAETFHKLCRQMWGPLDQEHVTRLYYRDHVQLLIQDFRSDQDFGEEQFSVDTPEDLEIVKLLLKASNGEPPGWKDLVKLKNDLLVNLPCPN